MLTRGVGGSSHDYGDDDGCSSSFGSGKTSKKVAEELRERVGVGPAGSRGHDGW